MSTPYREMAPRKRDPRPLSPEAEMRLLLEEAPKPRGVQRYGLWLVTAVGIACLINSLFSPSSLFSALYFLLPAIGVLIHRWRRKRKLRHLREQGFDVSAFEPRQRVDEPATRTRVELGDEADALFQEDGARRGALPARR